MGNDMNINIRSVTLGINWGKDSKQEIESLVSSFRPQALDSFSIDNTNIRTFRLLLSPINDVPKFSRASANSMVDWIADICDVNNIRWFCVPFNYFAENADVRAIRDVALDVVRSNQNAFINLIVARDGHISMRGALEAGKFIKAVSRLSNNGIDNFRVGTSCSCVPNGPFFPFSYQEGEGGFSLALEMTSAFRLCIEKNKGKSLEIIRETLIKLLVPQLKELDAVALDLEKITGLNYYGIDASLAPFPSAEEGLGDIIKLLGGEAYGSNGSIFITSYLTNILKIMIIKSNIRSTGFNGVMYSLLEDKSLSVNNDPWIFNPDLLLSSSSVCGCGYDMVPIPGDTFDEEIGGLILDVAALSVSLKKPLGVRVLPIPMKYENEFTDFSNDFLCNTRIRKLRNKAFNLEVFDNEIFNFLSADDDISSNK